MGLIARTGLAALATLALAGAASAGVNLVNNGSFEQGFAGWSVPPNAPPGPNGANFQTPMDNPHSGLRYAQLSSTQLLFISQGVQGTVPGTDYELEFWARNTLQGFGFNLHVRWEGQFVGSPIIESTTWTQYRLPLTSSFSGSLLEFGQVAFPFELHIDTISVRPVPAPSAMPLLALGGLAAFRLRRR